MGSPGHDTPPATGNDGLAIVEMLVAYLEYAEEYCRNSEELANIKKALRPLWEVYGLTRTVEFGPKRLKTLRRTMIAAGLSAGEMHTLRWWPYMAGCGTARTIHREIHQGHFRQRHDLGVLPAVSVAVGVFRVAPMGQ